MGLCILELKKSISMYDLSTNKNIFKKMFHHPQLDCCFINDYLSLSVGIDKELKLIDLEKNSFDIISKDDDIVKTVDFSIDEKYIITSNFNNKLKFWDLDSYSLFNIFSDEMKIMDVSLMDKTLALSGFFNGKWFIKVLDLRNIKNYIFQNEIPNIITSIATADDKCIIGRIDGNINVESFYDNSSYSFKAHKEETEDQDIKYPVNAVSISKKIFTTGGSDGYVYIWDIIKKKKIFKSKLFNQPISTISISDEYLTVASSYMEEDLKTDNR